MSKFLLDNSSFTAPLLIIIAQSLSLLFFFFSFVLFCFFFHIYDSNSLILFSIHQISVLIGSRSSEYPYIVTVLR